MTDFKKIIKSSHNAANPLSSFAQLLEISHGNFLKNLRNFVALLEKRKKKNDQD